jgi:hypothetical protein
VPRLRAAGFADVDMRGHAFTVSGGSDPDSYGAALIPFIGAFVAGRRGLSGADAQAWVDEQRALGERGELYFACTQFCVTATRPR